MPRLFVEEEGTRRVIDVGDDAVIVGRATDNQIVIRDRKSSRKHCRVLQQGSFYVLEDMNSSNGTLLNGAPATQDPLRHGDKIAIGEVEITFVDDGKGGPWEDNGASAAVSAEPPASEAATKKPEAVPAAKAPVESAPVPQAETEVDLEKSSDLLEMDDDILEEEEAAPVAAEAKSVPRLVVVNGPQEGEAFAVNKAPFFIGRKQTNNLPLNDSRVSGMHCRLVQESDRWFVEDLDSGNGVIIADNRQKRHPLHNGDVMLLGSTEIRIEGLPNLAVPGGASPEVVMQKVDHFGVSEDDISRIEITQVPTSPLQPVWTLLFGALFVGALYFTWDLVQSEVNKDRVVADPDNLVLGNPSFEDVNADGGAVPGWEVDSRGDAAALVSIDKDAFHGRRALEVKTQGSGERGFVRLVESDLQAVQEGERYELTAHLRSSGFHSVGVELLWFSNIDKKLVAESSEMGTARPGRYTYFQLATEVPTRLGASHCQVAITGHGRGTITVDNVVLKRVTKTEEEATAGDISIAVGDRSSAVELTVDSRGIFTAERGKKPRFRTVRFCAQEEQAFPFGQLFSLSSNPPEWRENGIVSGIFQFQAGATELVQVEQQFQEVGEQVKVTWRLLKELPEGQRAALLFEVDSSVERGPVALYESGQLVPTDGFESLAGTRGDEFSFGRHDQQLVLSCSAPVDVQFLPEAQCRDITTLQMTLPENTTVFEMYLSAVSGREKLRLQELFESARKAAEDRQYSIALKALAAVENEFPSDRNALQLVTERRASIEAMGEKLLGELDSIKKDFQRFPGAPIHSVFEKSARAVLASFEGTAFASRAQAIVDEVDRERERSGLARRGANSERLMDLGRSHMVQRNNNVARFYFEWVVSLDGPDKGSAEQQIRLLDERK